MKRLSGKNIVVTGGTSGIGRASAVKLAENGANVLICGRDENRGMQVVQEILAHGVKGKFVKCDVSRKEEVKNLFNEVFSFFDRVECAFNNAGIEGEITPFTESTEENWDTVMDVNLKGIWHCMKHEVTHMLANGGGSIVNMSSTSGIVGNGFGFSAYAAAKHAIVGLTKSVALEYAKDNLRVNAICPAFVETPMVDAICGKNPKYRRRFEMAQPMGRMAKSEEIANAVLYLCSSESSFVTGTAFVIDGGLTI